MAKKKKSSRKRPKTVKEEGDVRRNEYGEPVLVIVSQIQALCRGVQTQNGECRMKPSDEFLAHFNSEVVDLIEFCIQKAMNADRTTLFAEDVPKIGSLLPDV